MFNILWGCSSIGRASDWQSEGKGFDPPHLHQMSNSVVKSVMDFMTLFCFL